MSSPAARLAHALRDRLRPRRTHRHAAHYEQVLGTSLELRVVGATPGAGPRAEAAALAEIDRLADVFSGYSPASEMSRWQESFGREVAVSPELAEVLAESERWRERTRGAFDPSAEWRPRGGAPETGPLWSVDRERGTARRLREIPASLNAVAKGFIVDRACALAAGTEGVVEALVNIGGDLRHIGGRPVRAAIADPFADAENAPPLGVVLLRDQGLATSGGYRRGRRVGERWFSHILDPRTGLPADAVASASVLAESAMLADVLSTAFSVLDPEESLALADSVPGVGCLLVARDGTRAANRFWQEHAA